MRLLAQCAANRRNQAIDLREVRPYGNSDRHVVNYRYPLSVSLATTRAAAASAFSRSP